MQHLSRSEAAALIFRLNKLIQVMDEKRTDQVEKASALDRHI